MTDQYGDFPATPVSPARDVTEVTPHDTNPLPTVAKALYVGSTGNVEIITPGGTTAVFRNVPDGSIIPAYATHVKAANTTATDIVALHD